MYLYICIYLSIHVSITATPSSNGSIPAMQRERLETLGRWNAVRLHPINPDSLAKFSPEVSLVTRQGTF